MKFTAIAGAAMVLAFTAGTTLAAPCNTGSTTDKSSKSDTGSKNLAGGEQPASPGTVGGDNVGANQGLGDKPGAGASATKGNEEPGSKNLAGGQQPPPRAPLAQ